MRLEAFGFAVHGFRLQSSLPWLLAFRLPFPQLQWRLSTPKFPEPLDLPDAPVRCTIRVAYQAADAIHPKRAEQARREARKSRRKSSNHRCLQAVGFHGRAPYGKGAGRTVTILTTGEGSFAGLSVPGGDSVFHSDHQGTQRLNRCRLHGAEFLEERRRRMESAKVLKTLEIQGKLRAKLVFGAVGAMFGGYFCRLAPCFPIRIGRRASEARRPVENL